MHPREFSEADPLNSRAVYGQRGVSVRTSPEANSHLRLNVVKTKEMVNPAPAGWSLRCDADDFFGTGMMVVVFGQVGTTAWLRGVLNMSARTSLSSSTHSFSTRPGTLSGPADVRALVFRSTLFLVLMPRDRLALAVLRLDHHF